MKPKRSKLLLIVGIGASLLGLGGLALGVLSVIHTSQNVAVHQGILDRLKAEGDDLARRPRLPGSEKRLREIPQEQQTMRSFLAEYEGDRNLAFVILAGGLVVLIAGGVCVLAYVIKRARLSSARDEGEDDEPSRKAGKRRREDR